MILDLSDEETTALLRLLSTTIDEDRYPLSPRVQTLKAILGKVRSEPVRASLPPLKHYGRPRATTARRRRSALTLKPEPGSPMTLGSAAVARGSIA
jgi:hypothetical protein